MFDPGVIEYKRRKLERDIKAKGGVLGHGGRLVRYPVDVVRYYTKRLAEDTDPKTNDLTRRLTPDEQEYMANDRFLCTVDWRYWAERYCKIRKEGSHLGPMYPLWASQKHVLRALAKLERQRYDQDDPDGCLLDVLKARQLGVSTMTQSIIAHRVSLHSHTYSLIAADRLEQSQYLFGMLETTLGNVPGYVRSPDLSHPRTGPLVLENHSTVQVEAGRTMTGRDMEEGEGKRGQLGVGKTYSAVHLSELALWPYPEMMDSSLLPAIPRARRTFCVRESTAQGRNNYWHTQWQLDVAGKNRFKPVFIPWGIDPHKYWMPYPADWSPTPQTVAYVERAEAAAPKWLFGDTITLTKEQIYWYETERAAAEAREQFEPGALADFLANYPAEPEESFQHSGRSIFGPALLEKLRAYSKPIVAAISIEPAMDLARLRRGEV